MTCVKGYDAWSPFPECWGNYSTIDLTLRKSWVLSSDLSLNHRLTAENTCSSLATSSLSLSVNSISLSMLISKNSSFCATLQKFLRKLSRTSQVYPKSTEFSISVEAVWDSLQCVSERFLLQIGARMWFSEAPYTCDKKKYIYSLSLFPIKDKLNIEFTEVRWDLPSGRITWSIFPEYFFVFRLT